MENDHNAPAPDVHVDDQLQKLTELRDVTKTGNRCRPQELVLTILNNMTCHIEYV